MNPPSGQIYGLIGYPVKHSLSPVMHNTAFRHLGIDAKYRLFPVKPEELEAFLLEDIAVKDINGNEVRAKEISGFNVTIPHKVRTKQILEKEFPPDKSAPGALMISRYADLVGAVNTVQRVGEKLEYYNTDALGFEKSLSRDLDFDTYEKNALVLGCGGAGRAVIAALCCKGNRINRVNVFDASAEAADSAKKHFSQFPGIMKLIEFVSAERIPRVIKDCQLLINTTPVGMKQGDASVIDKALLHDELYVYDVVYNRETQLIKDAKSLRLRAAGGLGMLLYQGVAAFEKWTDKTLSFITINAMKQALRKELNKRSGYA
ncbi:MAG: shikimate dehydrogenase [Candidatus Omnitrophota bacterium]